MPRNSGDDEGKALVSTRALGLPQQRIDLEGSWKRRFQSSENQALLKS
ncbi:hypothetical protein [Prochlorococcus marinus]|nr:hypothetical protein [Prochlorococcus marinus]KZR78241.1 hypothetical protein PMIT1323_00412 [Prochlorococcus marinus str. MIT 1323]